jgi:hypothetical protein
VPRISSAEGGPRTLPPAHVLAGIMGGAAPAQPWDVLPEQATPPPPPSSPPRTSRPAFTQAFTLASAPPPSPEQVATLEQEVLRRLLTRLVRLTQQLEQAATQ